MKYLIPGAFLLTMVACTSENHITPAVAPSTPVSELFTIEDNSAYSFGNLKIYPIKATEAYHREYAGLGNYLSLAEAVSSKKVKVRERSEAREERERTSPRNVLSSDGPGGVGSIIPAGDGEVQRRNAIENDPNVNGLVIQNTSEDTVFVMAGEIVEGGKQNRVIAYDFILKPHEMKDMDVYCVEHGRWTAREGGNAFSSVYGVTAPAVRKQVVQHRNQSGVWNEVSNTLSMYNADNSTDTYTGLAESETYQSGVGAYVNHFKEQLNDENIVGFVAVSGNEVVGMEVFYRNSMFKKQIEALVQSYATGAESTGSAPTMAFGDVQGYFNDQLDRYDDYESRAEQGEDYQMLAHRKRIIHFLDF